MHFMLKNVFVGFSLVILVGVALFAVNFLTIPVVTAADPPQSSPAIFLFTSSKGSIVARESVNLLWNVAANPAPTLLLQHIDISTNNVISTLDVTGTSFLSFSPTDTASYVLTAKNSLGTVISNPVIISVAASVPTDTQAPTAPTNLQVAPVGLFNLNIFSLNLSWAGSTDNVGIAGYKIFRNNTVIATTNIGTVSTSVSDTLHTDTLVSPSTTYTYAVAAFDAAGNTSPQSNSVVASTQPLSTFMSFPEIISFFSNHSGGLNARLIRGQSATLTWKVTGVPAPTISIDNGIGVVTGSSITVTPTQTTTYTLTAENNNGVSRTAQLTVTVVEPNQNFIGDWVQVSNFAPVNRTGMSALVFKNKMWVMGGGSNDVVWSTDGVTWNTALDNNPNNHLNGVGNRMWTSRYSQASVVFNNKMWILGGAGTADGAGRGNDVWWSEDGVNWNEATAHAAWSSRYTHSAISFNNKIWVMGGLTATSSAIDRNGILQQVHQGVWSSTDGANWNLEIGDPGWVAGTVFSTLVFNNKMWVIGSTIRSTTAPEQDNKARVWSSSDGITWTKMTNDIGFSLSGGPFSSHGAVVFNNKMWVFGGTGSADANEVFSSSDGINWRKENIKDGWKQIVLSASLVHNGTMWVLGGTGSNNVWKFMPATVETISAPSPSPTTIPSQTSPATGTFTPLSPVTNSSPSNADVQFIENLRFGLRNNAQVRLLQAVLTQEGLFPDGLATGNFFSVTLNAVKAFQLQHGITPTGFVGPLTRAALNE